MSSNIIWKFLDGSDLCGCTLVVPSVAVGNVAQLACDLLISSLKMQKIASVHSPALIPVLGYDPYDLNSTNLSSCCELYKCPSQNLAVLQFRAPLVYEDAQDFLEEFITKMKEMQIKDVIILTSSYAHERKHIMSSPFRYILNDYCPYKDKIKELNCPEHDLVDGTLKIHGGGFASLMFEVMRRKSIPCVLLFKYCSEGDNIPDAYDMISFLNAVLPIFKEHVDLQQQLVQPVSWKLLFGRPPPADIY